MKSSFARDTKAKNRIAAASFATHPDPFGRPRVRVAREVHVSRPLLLLALAGLACGPARSREDDAPIGSNLDVAQLGEECAPGWQDNDGNGICQEGCSLLPLDACGAGSCTDASGIVSCVCREGWVGLACSRCRAGSVRVGAACLPTAPVHSDTARADAVPGPDAPVDAEAPPPESNVLRVERHWSDWLEPVSIDLRLVVRSGPLATAFVEERMKLRSAASAGRGTAVVEGSTVLTYQAAAPGFAGADVVRVVLEDVDGAQLTADLAIVSQNEAPLVSSGTWPGPGAWEEVADHHEICVQAHDPDGDRVTLIGDGIDERGCASVRVNRSFFGGEACLAYRATDGLAVTEEALQCVHWNAPPRC